jgi:hypothetical protein
VIEQGGENGAIPYTLQRVRGRGLQQPPHLRIAERRRAALIIIRGWPLDAVHRIAEDGVALTEVIEQRRQRRELAAYARRCETPCRQVFAPGDHVRARHRAQFAMVFEVRECDELRNIDLICAAGFRIGNVGEPFQLGTNIREIAVLFRRERPFAMDTNQLVCHRLPVAVVSNAIMYFIEFVINR